MNFPEPGRSQVCWDSSEDAAGSESALWAIAAALYALADAIPAAARHIGTGDAATSLGAIEALSVEVGRIADAIADRAGEESDG